MKSLALTSILAFDFWTPGSRFLNRLKTHFVSRRADLSDKIELIDIFKSVLH